MCIRLAGVGVGEGGVETTLVSGYLDGRGLEGSPLLTRAQLTAFTTECGRVNCDRVLEILNHRLTDTGSTSTHTVVCQPLYPLVLS